MQISGIIEWLLAVCVCGTIVRNRTAPGARARVRFMQSEPIMLMIVMVQMVMRT